MNLERTCPIGRGSNITDDVDLDDICNNYLRHVHMEGVWCPDMIVRESLCPATCPECKIPRGSDSGFQAHVDS